MNTTEFQSFLAGKRTELYRDMPWRQDTRPYYILVSELMLQQTQVSRVIPKFEAFTTQFPNVQVLAEASLADVLKLWQGLGYNRRAKFLHESAKQVSKRTSFPSTLKELIELPGVGINTAGALLVYSYNQPHVFIETNIRTVYMHHFFNGQLDVTDTQIRELLAATISPNHPREFYWALMDYGSWLKANGVRNNASSKHYKKQSMLKGSLRETRGVILRELSADDSTFDQLRVRVSMNDRFVAAIDSLKRDQLITQTGEQICLTK